MLRLSATAVKQNICMSIHKTERSTHQGCRTAVALNTTTNSSQKHSFCFFKYQQVYNPPEAYTITTINEAQSES